MIDQRRLSGTDPGTWNPADRRQNNKVVMGNSLPGQTFYESLESIVKERLVLGTMGFRESVGLIKLLPDICSDELQILLCR